MVELLPYHESFNYPDGNSWPSSWTVPSPYVNWSDPTDINNGRARVSFDNKGGYSSQFGARIYTAPATDFDLFFSVDLSEFVPTMSDPDPLLGPEFTLQIQLQATSAHTNYYQIRLDPSTGLTATMRQYDTLNNGSWSQHVIGTVDLSPSGSAPIDLSQPFWVNIDEAPDGRGMMVYQGNEPSTWQIFDYDAFTPTSPRFIDLYVHTRFSGSPHLYFDDFTLVDYGAPEVSQPLPYSEPFNYPDGNSWAPPYAGQAGWVIPGPDGMSGGLGDVHGQQGRITLTGDWFNGTPQWSARLAIDDAPTFDMTFSLDIFEVADQLRGHDTGFYFRVQLEDAAAGTVFYEIYFDSAVSAAHPQAAMYRYPGGPGSFADTVATGGYVTLNNVDIGSPMQVRIQESGTDRSFKVWQGEEPDLWTILYSGAPVHSGQRHIDLTTFAEVTQPANVWVDNIAVNVAGITWISVGATDHFEFFYDSALGPVDGGADALAAMVHAEADLQNHFAWWGSTAPWSNGPDLLAIRFILPAHNTVPNALAYYDRSVESIFFIWNKVDPASTTYCAIDAGWRGEFVHELGHHFQRLQGDRWGFAGSMVESQATFLDRIFRRQIGDMASLANSGYGDGVTFWIQADPQTRTDYVNQVVQADGGDGPFMLALGCELLFLNYLCTHRGYSATSITRAAAPTMRKMYENLTGDKIDPFPAFLAEIDIHFPRGEYFPPFWWESWPSKDIANPYPFPGNPTPPAIPGGALAMYDALGGSFVDVLRQSLRRN